MQENAHELKPKSSWRHAPGLSFICQKARKVLKEGIMQVLSSSLYFPVPSARFWKRLRLLLAARARKSLDRSLGERRHFIHQSLSKSKTVSLSHAAASPWTFSCIILTHIRVENFNLSHCTAPSALKDPKKHQGKKRTWKCRNIKWIIYFKTWVFKASLTFFPSS